MTRADALRANQGLNTTGTIQRQDQDVFKNKRLSTLELYSDTDLGED